MNGSTPIPARRGLRRYASLYGALWRNSVVREMGFRTNFLLWIVVELLWFALQISFITVVYQHTDRIRTWTKWEVVMLIGASHFIQQIFQAIFLSNCTQISDHVRTGKLDFMLLLPINTRFIVSLRQVDLGGFVNAISAVAVMVYCARQLHLLPSLAQLAGFTLLCCAGVLIHYCLMFLLATASFWTIRAQGIVWGYYSMFHISRLPDVVFRGTLKAVLTFVVPMLLVVNVPVKVLINKLGSPWEMVLLAAMTAACFVISECVWRFSLKHYTSASS